MLTETWASRDFGVDVGDRIAFALRLSDSDSINARLRIRAGVDANDGTMGALCNSKEVVYRPNTYPEIKIGFYSDELAMSHVFHDINLRLQQSEAN